MMISYKFPFPFPAEISSKKLYKATIKSESLEAKSKEIRKDSQRFAQNKINIS